MKSSTGVFWLLFCFLIRPGMCSTDSSMVMTGAEQTDSYLTYLKGKRVGLCVNQTSRIGEVHLVDSLRKLGVDIRCVFAPEHGFRGTADAGEKVKDGKDPLTGLPIISLYGSKLKPSEAEMRGIDLLIFDIQDVGARFYTYISTLHYLIESCSENQKQLLILDRPNPHGAYADGFVLDTHYRSFVGIAPIPVVHGLTLGEYARMAIGEKWINCPDNSFLTIVQCKGYRHDMPWPLDVKPSPNLPNNRAIALYPSLCFFEGTDVSVGRGTSYPFQICGSPHLDRVYTYSFIPQSLPGAKDPPHLNKQCYGIDLRAVTTPGKGPFFTLSYLIEMYNAYDDKSLFFSRPDFFDKLAGTDRLRKMILSGKSEQEIRDSWQSELSMYMKKREKYLLYP